MPKTSIVIVAYNNREDLERCLESLPERKEIIVVDNASNDGTAEMVREYYPYVTLITNEENLGYGTACNQGLDIASGEYALILNADIRAEENAVDVLTDFIYENPKATLCGGMLLHPDGSIQESAANNLTLWAVFCEQLFLEKLFPRSPLFSPYWISKRYLERHKNQPPPLRVAQVMGACMMLRRVHDRFPRFDERYFLYCEDTDLCFRINKSGGEIYYVPAARFQHALGKSSEHRRWLAVRYYNRGKELFFRIHYGRFASTICFLLNRLGSLLRLIAWGIPCLLTLGLHPKFRSKFILWALVLFAKINPYPR
ncbi:MAG TPA: glycosyltransferase family 2 protein [Fimbriimonadales bacterium]|nr:glycosyltransferase family 2 protein [Fimbriimonadales bacterium]